MCQRKETTGHPRTVTTNANRELLLQRVLQFPKRSLRRTSLKLGVSDRSVWRMFKELGGFAYRIQVAQRLTETDERARLQYCSRVLSMTYEQCVRRDGTHFEHMLYRRIYICIVLTTACYNYIQNFLSTFVISVTFVLPHTVFIEFRTVQGGGLGLGETWLAARQVSV